MLNEKNEVIAILEGRRINKKYTYRSCYLLAKYFKTLEYDNIKIREEIFNWANKYNVYISDDLNSIIQRVIHDKHTLISDINIKISNDDIIEIVKRFDKYYTRLTAFAILCFAKKYADKNGIFYISCIGISNWINIDQTSLSKKYLKELIDFGYIERVSQNDLKFIHKRNKNISKMIMYKIKVNFSNTGNHIINDINFIEEFNNIINNII